MPGLNLHLYPSDIRFESRMMRMTGSLAEAGLFEEIHLVGVWEEGLPTEERIDQVRTIHRLRLSPFWMKLGGLGRIGRLLEWNWLFVRKYAGRDLAMLNPHIVWALPGSAYLASKSGAVHFYDTHELETETHASRGLRKKLSKFIENRYYRTLHATGVVSNGIKNWYEQHFPGIPVHTLKNYPLKKAAPVVPVPLKERFGIPAGDQLYIYQGRLSRGAVIDLLISIFRDLPTSKHLVFLGFGPLQDEVEALACTTPNIHFHPAVPFDQVPPITSAADAAFALFQDTCLSYHHVLPNKMLEALNAGVPVIASNLPDMAEEIDAYEAGWLVEPEFAPLLELLQGITNEEIAGFRKGAARWSEDNTWDVVAARMVAIYRDLLSGRDVGPAGP